MKKRRTGPEKAALVANIIAIAIVVALVGAYAYQAWLDAWIIKQTTDSMLRQDQQHQQEETE